MCVCVCPWQMAGSLCLPKTASFGGARLLPAEKEGGPKRGDSEDNLALDPPAVPSPGGQSHDGGAVRAGSQAGSVLGGFCAGSGAAKSSTVSCPSPASQTVLSGASAAPKGPQGTREPRSLGQGPAALFPPAGQALFSDSGAFASGLRPPRVAAFHPALAWAAGSAQGQSGDHQIHSPALSLLRRPVRRGFPARGHLLGSCG